MMKTMNLPKMSTVKPPKQTTTISYNGSCTDRGAQFTSKCFRNHLDELDMIQSFSAKGHPYDNAFMECFFKYLV